MKFSLILGGFSLMAAARHVTPFSEEREQIAYSYANPAAYKHLEKAVDYIIEGDTHREHWPCTRSLAPTCRPPPMTDEAIKSLEMLPGIIVHKPDLGL